MGIDTKTRQQITSHYRTYADTYQQIWSQLDTLHNRFRQTDLEGKCAYLKLSYVNSVISVRTPVDTHEAALRQVMSGQDLETALQSVNYRRKKENSIRQTVRQDSVWERIAAYLEEQDVNSAHEIALDQLRLVGTVKTPFLFAMLGYTEKMCIDGNEANLMGMDRTPQTDNIERYEELCYEICSEFSTLREELDPFHLHWVIFDWQRHPKTDGKARAHQRQSEPVTHHDAWFEAALDNEPRIRRRMDSIA